MKENANKEMNFASAEEKDFHNIFVSIAALTTALHNIKKNRASLRNIKIDGKIF